MYVVPVCHRFFAKAAVRRIGGTWVVQSTHIQYVAKGCRKRGRERDCTFLFALMLCTTDNVLMSTFLDAWNLSYKFTQSTQNNTCAFLRALKASRLVEKQSATRNLILRSPYPSSSAPFSFDDFCCVAPKSHQRPFFSLSGGLGCKSFWPMSYKKIKP